jgi:hypothetical protein
MSIPLRPNELGADKTSESELLNREVQQAKAAMDQSVADLKQSLRTAADLQLWAQHHPWLTVGAAAAGGFAAGSTIASLLSGSPPPDTNGQPPQAAYAQAPPRQNSVLWSALMGPLFDLAKVAIQSSIAAAMGGAMQAEAQEEANQQRAAETVANADPL